MTKTLIPTEMSNGQNDNTKSHQKIDCTAIAGRLKTVNWSNYSYHTGVVNQFTGPTFPVPAAAVKSKGHTFKIYQDLVFALCASTMYYLARLPPRGLV